MSATVELKVVDAGRHQDSSRVPLTEGQMESLGASSNQILSGDQVTVIGPEGELTGFAWPDPSTNGEIPLSPSQRSELSISVGSMVTVKAGEHTDERTCESGSAFRDEGKPTTVNINEDCSTDEDSESSSAFGDITYDDVGGLENELSDIRQMVELPLRRPELFEDVGIDPPKGVLMHGPPGTGKTLIAQAIANETDARFTKIDGPEVMSKYTGESEKRLRKIFEDARKAGPAIIFFDEIDSLGTERDDGGDVENRLVGQLLSLMDGLNSEEHVIVIGATNRADTIDPALRRSGRFDREIHIGAPSETGRAEILDIHTDNMTLSDDVDIEALASQTTGFVGADLAALTREAAMEAIQNTFDGEMTSIDDVLDGEVDDVEITMGEFNRAMARVDPSALRSISAQSPSTTYDDIGGLDDKKEFLEEIVAWPLTRSPLFNETNTDAPTGVLIHGPEGVGKTLLSEATAGEFGINFTRVNGASIFQKYVGESEEKIEDLFRTAEQASPVIIFFEQLDAIAGQSAADMSGTQERVISQLLAELDAVRNDPTITVIGETTDASNIDKRLLQSGRFEETIEITEPDGRSRREIFEILTGDKPLSESISPGELAAQTDGLTGGDIESIVRNASLQAIREHTEKRGEESHETAGNIELTESHFDAAIDRVMD